MQVVSSKNLQRYLQKYSLARGGLLYEKTYSEAMFILVCDAGVYQLHASRRLIYWIGMQNATARWTALNGKSFTNVEAALDQAVNAAIYNAVLYYSEDAIERLRWIANYIEKAKNGTAPSDHQQSGTL